MLVIDELHNILAAHHEVLKAAATAIRMIESGDIVGRGTGAALLLPEPPVAVIDGRMRPVSPWRRLSDAAEEAIRAAIRTLPERYSTPSCSGAPILTRSSGLGSCSSKSGFPPSICHNNARSIPLRVLQ
jgi:hypothetical protein